MSDSLWFHVLYSPWNSPGQNTGKGGLSLLQGIFPTQGLNSGLPHWQADSLPAEPQGKPKNTGVGGLSLLQRSFPTRKSNQGLPPCRWILYQLSYQGSLEIQLNEINYLATQLTSSIGDLGLSHLILPLAEVCCTLWRMTQWYPSSIQCCLNIICIDNLIIASGQ